MARVVTLTRPGIALAGWVAGDAAEAARLARASQALTSGPQTPLAGDLVQRYVAGSLSIEQAIQEARSALDSDYGRKSGPASS